jgi:hypothetical protein
MIQILGIYGRSGVMGAVHLFFSLPQRVSLPPANSRTTLRCDALITPILAYIVGLPRRQGCRALSMVVPLPICGP